MTNMTLISEASLTFDLSGDPGLTFDLSSDDALTIGITTPTYLDVISYDGTTDVSPDFNGVTLETAHKLLTEDIIVRPIQVENVSNTSGGVTVYIGGIA